MADLYVNTLNTPNSSEPPPAAVSSHVFTASTSAATSIAAASVQQAVALAGVNLALHRPVYSSSQEGDAFSAISAVDGAQSTRWASSWSDPQWIYVDLGVPYKITKVVLRWEAYAKNYEIQMSDDARQWQSIYHTTQGKGGTEAIDLQGTGRYLRVYMTARSTEYGDSLYELEAYGGEKNPSPAATNTQLKPLIDKAEGKPATASSAESDVWSARHAVDGSNLSRWSSGFSDNEWISVDLGSVQAISRVILNWESAYARAYKLQVSNDSKNWKDIYSTTAGDASLMI